MRKPIITSLFAAAVFIGGCSEEKVAEPQAVKAPPPKTVNAIVTDLSRPIDPVLNAALTSAPLSKRASAEALNGLKQARTRYQTEENGPAAFDQVAARLKTEIRRSEDKSLWEYVVFACDAHDILNPERARDIARVREKAKVQLRRPRAEVASFWIADYETNDRVAFIEVTIPTTGQTEKGRVRVGDSILGLRVVEFIGDNEGLRLEYEKTGELFAIFRKRSGR